MFQTVIDASQIKVVEADASELNVPLIAPFTIASSRLEYVGNVSLRIELEDGSVGWGETPILRAVTAEDQPTALAKALLKLTPTMSCRKVLEKICDLLPGHEFASVTYSPVLFIISKRVLVANRWIVQIFLYISDDICVLVLMPMLLQRGLSYAGVIWLLFLIGHLYLVGVWLSKNRRTNTMKTHA
jgi:hypothetical protein